MQKNGWTIGRALVPAVLLVAMTDVLAAAAGGADKLVGTWKNKDGDTLTFTAAGRFRHESGAPDQRGVEEGTYACKEDTITFTFDGTKDEAETYKYELAGDTFTLLNEEGEKEDTFSRQGAAAPDRRVPPRASSTTRPAGAASRPSADEARKMATQTLLDFNAAVQKKDFTDFQKEMAPAARKQFTADDLKKAFQAFIDKGIDIGGIKDAEPLFEDSPLVVEDQLLIQGHYPLAKDHVYFKVTYQRVEDVWRVLSISVSVREPMWTESRTLATKSILDFNGSVLAKDFSEFHKTLAPAFQEKYSPEKLKETFKVFIEKEINLTGIKGAHPMFTVMKAEGDSLRLAGHYPTRPLEVHFDLSYSTVGGEWRLLGINVNVKEPEKATETP